MYEQLYVGFYGTEPLPENTGVGLYYREEAGVHVLAAFQARQQDRMKYPPNWPVPPEDWSWVACVPPDRCWNAGHTSISALTADSKSRPGHRGLAAGRDPTEADQLAGLPRRAER